MKVIKLITVVILLSFTGINYAQIDRSVPPSPGPAPEIKLGNYETFELPNGLKVFVVENNKLPVVSFSLVFDYDPILEAGSAGYVSAAGDLLRTGTKTKTKDKLDEEIDFIGASVSTSSTGVFASSLKKHTEKLLELMSDILINADFKQEELDKIIKQNKSGLAAAKDSPSQIAGIVRNVLMYGVDHPYGEPITEVTLDSVSLEKCKNFYSTYMKPNVSYLAVVGDVNKEDAKQLVEKYFSGWKSGEVPTHNYKKPKAPLVNKVVVVDRPNAVQSAINLVYPIELKTGSEDAIKASVMNSIFGGQFASRLNLNLREKNAFTYGAGSSLSADELVGSFAVNTEVRNSVTDSAFNEILNEMKKLRNEKVEENELNLVKNYMTGSFARSLERPQTIANFALNTARYNLAPDYYQNYLKKLSSVTSDDVMSMAKKYLMPDKSYLLAVGNSEEIAENLKQFSLSGKIEYVDMYGNPVDISAKNIPEGVTAQLVLDKYIEAMGGREKLESINDRTASYTASVQGMTLKMTVYQKMPNKLKQEMDAGVFTQTVLFDGTKGVQKSSMTGEAAVEGEALKQLKLQSEMALYLDYEKFGIKPELKGIEKVNGKDAYKMELLLPNGKKWTHYYDAENGLKVREVTPVETPQASMTQTLDYGEYKDYNGFLYPAKVTTTVGPQSIIMELVSLEVNTGLTDQIFEVK